MTNVAALDGAALDEWAGRANGWLDYPDDSVERGRIWHMDGERSPFGPIMEKSCWTPSTDWALAGPIIERERIEIIPSVADDGQWSAWAYQRGPFYFGATPLVAAMRAFVASRFGPIVPPPVVERRQVERCAAYRDGSEMRCKCGRSWDISDTDAPTCGKATVKDRR